MNDFEVLAGMANGFVQRFFRDNSQATPSNFLQALWIGPTDGFAGTPPNYISLIVNRLGGLEAVVVTPGGELQHWIRDFSGHWGPGSVFISPPTAMGPPSLIQGTYGSGNLELLVPTKADPFNNNVTHFWLDNSKRTIAPMTQWAQSSQRFAFGTTFYVALIQGDYGNPVPPGAFDGGPGNLECVVVGPPDDQMVHWWRDQNGFWQASQQITDLNTNGGAGGCPAMVTLGGGFSGNFHADFHVIVPTNSTPPTLAHYKRDNSGAIKWVFLEDLGPILSSDIIYPSLITSPDFQSLELVVAAGNTTGLVHLRQSAGGGAWIPTKTFASNNGGGAVGFVELKGSGGQ